MARICQAPPTFTCDLRRISYKNSLQRLCGIFIACLTYLRRLRFAAAESPLELSPPTIFARAEKGLAFCVRDVSAGANMEFCARKLSTFRFVGGLKCDAFHP